jgi:3-hydroxyisobutyrate dehydrogenase-like beta-hydroxyacid dehydrogenase
MNDITIIGLGVIGAALAQTLLKNGYKVTVWNRSPEKAEALKNL